MSRLGKAKFRCACCGKSFEGFVLMVCDECMDQRRDDETHQEMVDRLKAKHDTETADSDKKE